MNTLIKFYARTSLILMLFPCSLSCNNTEINKIERKGEPTIYNVADSDKEMNIAIQSARQTLDKFKKALISRDKKFSGFALKEQFNTPKGYEHIWINDIALKGDKYFGVVNNLPESTTEVKLGDTIKINNDKISDWLYVEDRKLRGGYTLRLLRNRMTESERLKFDSGIKLVIEDHD